MGGGQAKSFHKSSVCAAAFWVEHPPPLPSSTTEPKLGPPLQAYSQETAPSESDRWPVRSHTIYPCKPLCSSDAAHTAVDLIQV
jgi:hypothetical protein